MLFGKRKKTVSLDELRQRATSGVATQKADAEVAASLRADAAAVSDATNGEATLGDSAVDDKHAALDIALGRHKGVTKTLVARDLVKTYRGRNVVNHVNITLRTGEIV